MDLQLFIRDTLLCLLVTIVPVGCADRHKKSAENQAWRVSLAISADTPEEFSKQLTGTWKNECKKTESPVPDETVMTTLIFNENSFTALTRLYGPKDSNCVDESNDTHPWTRKGEIKLGPKNQTVSNAYEVEWIGGINSTTGTTCITYDIFSIKDGDLSHGIEGGPLVCNTRDERPIELYKGKFTRIK